MGGGVGKLFRRAVVVAAVVAPRGWARVRAHGPLPIGPGSGPGPGPWALAHWGQGEVGQNENHKIKLVLLNIG